MSGCDCVPVPGCRFLCKHSRVWLNGVFLGTEITTHHDNAKFVGVYGSGAAETPGQRTTEDHLAVRDLPVEVAVARKMTLEQPE